MPDLPNSAVLRDTAEEDGRRKYFVVATEPDGSSNVIEIILDSPNGSITIKKVDSGGADVSAYGSITAKIGDLGGTNKVAKFRECKVCVDDGSGGTAEKRAWILMTDPEDLP